MAVHNQIGVYQKGVLKILIYGVDLAELKITAGEEEKTPRKYGVYFNKAGVMYFKYKGKAIKISDIKRVQGCTFDI